MAAITELSHRLRSLHFAQTDRTHPILFFSVVSPKFNPLFCSKIPKLDDWEAVLDPGLQISGRNGDQRRAGAVGEEEVAGRRLEGRVGMVLRRGLEEAETGGEKLHMEKDSGEEMEDLRASVAVNGETEEPHQIFVDLTEPNSKRSHCEPT